MRNMSVISNVLSWMVVAITMPACAVRCYDDGLDQKKCEKTDAFGDTEHETVYPLPSADSDHDEHSETMNDDDPDGTDGVEGDGTSGADDRDDHAGDEDTSGGTSGDGGETSEGNESSGDTHGGTSGSDECDELGYDVIDVSRRGDETMLGHHGIMLRHVFCGGIAFFSFKSGTKLYIDDDTARLQGEVEVIDDGCTSSHYEGTIWTVELNMLLNDVVRDDVWTRWQWTGEMSLPSSEVISLEPRAEQDISFHGDGVGGFTHMNGSSRLTYDHRIRGDDVSMGSGRIHFTIVDTCATQNVTPQ